MPQNDIDNGRSICVVGIASLRLVKFVIFLIGQRRRREGVGEEGKSGVLGDHGPQPSINGTSP
jgi:hypothetical protein